MKDYTHLIERKGLLLITKPLIQLNSILIVKLADKFRTGSVDNLTGKNRKISQRRKDAKIVLVGVVSET